MSQNLDDITGQIIGTALRIHKKFGGTMLESAYEMLLYHLLIRRGLKVERQRLVTFEMDGMIFENAFRVDLLVNGVVVVEVKSVDPLRKVYEKQLLTYLRFMGLPVGLLLNFGQETLKDGIKRIVNNLDPGDSPGLRVNNRPNRPVDPQSN